MRNRKTITRFIKNRRKKLINSFKYAKCGFKSAYKKEQNLKIHILVMIMVIIAGFLLKISITEWMFCIILFGLLISSELMNTAIEALVDLVMPRIHPKAKFIKDVSASAVLVLAISSAIIGVIIFLPKIINLIK